MRKDHIHDGIVCCIEPEAIKDIENVLKEHNPELIIEFGTYRGGFTLYLSKWFPEVPIYTIDIIHLLTNEVSSIFRKRDNVSFLITQRLFKKEFLISFLLAMPIKKFLFIDNGCKADETKLYAQMLRPGDLLGIHDWPSEVNYQNVDSVLEGFNEHPINKIFEQPGYSETRFFIRKSYKGRQKLPNIEKILNMEGKKHG